MQISPYQAKYYAYQLTKRCPSDTPEKLSAILSNAQVDLNPHQIDAEAPGGEYNVKEHS